ncbi:MAG: TIGR03915 family putative DNA repair protein [Oscillospiraceae bacterium]|nr:TIGR03915 family putative DNA repair protein [Oscillospiraceae bacterium]
MAQVCYRYDGTFEGFLTCIFESYVNHEPPCAFLTPDQDEMTLWEEREVITDEAHAQRVFDGLGRKTSPLFRHQMERAYLTCLPDRDMILYTLIRRGFAEGDRVRQDLTDPNMAKVTLALQKLDTEWDHLKGFVRFSDLDGYLVGEIEPKNRVLSLLAPHFAARLNGEKVVLYDRTHHEVLFAANFRWTIQPVEDFHIGPAGEEELAWRRMWKSFFNTLAIEGRINPKCQSTHLPKRYRHVMTEFMEEETPQKSLPEGYTSKEKYGILGEPSPAQG